ncbi:MAG: type II toxin-antitoxin system RelE/ParE family toxin [Nitrospinae bacterium]|nr:type II toxin-antitoxin system RelE/ParE family toxin [Nitrospinota bacterium]
MTRTLEYLDEALEEAEEAARWYAERSFTAAVGFTDELDIAAAEIERAPTTWPACDHGTRRFLLRRFPYCIVYRIEATRVVIVAVAHARRRPGYWRQRLEGPG